MGVRFGTLGVAIIGSGGLGIFPRATEASDRYEAIELGDVGCTEGAFVEIGKVNGGVVAIVEGVPTVSCLAVANGAEGGFGGAVGLCPVIGVGKFAAGGGVGCGAGKVAGGCGVGCGATVGVGIVKGTVGSGVVVVMAGGMV